MKFRIIGIVVLSLVLALGTANAQEAEDEPEETIRTYLGEDSDEIAILDALPSGHRDLADEAFSDFKVNTPAEYLEAHSKWLIGVLADHHAVSPVKASVGEKSVANSLPGYVADLFAMEGYSPAFTGILIQAEEVGAEVAAGNAWQRATCNDCNFISAVVYQPTACGHHSVWGRHWTRNPHAPTQISYASVNIDC